MATLRIPWIWVAPLWIWMFHMAALAWAWQGGWPQALVKVLTATVYAPLAGLAALGLPLWGPSVGWGWRDPSLWGWVAVVVLWFGLWNLLWRGGRALVVQTRRP